MGKILLAFFLLMTGVGLMILVFNPRSRSITRAKPGILDTASVVIQTPAYLRYIPDSTSSRIWDDSIFGLNRKVAALGLVGIDRVVVDQQLWYHQDGSLELKGDSLSAIKSLLELVGELMKQQELNKTK